VEPARLRRGHREKLISILGLEAGSTLRRIVDARGGVRAVPADGMLLTARLAETLDVAPGDEVEVELLQGRRLRRSIVVREVADEPIGLQAYVDLAVLDAMTGEGRAVSGAFLAVDPLYGDDLYRRLKETPGIEGLTVKEAARRGFERTIEENFRLSLFLLVAFACVIAAGMVYNSARIALSERGRELASLRVLGFSRGEVAAMLLGEQGLLVLLALPVGSAIGFGLCALIALRADTDLFRLPLQVSGLTFVFAFAVVAAAAAASAVGVRRRLDRADLVAVLKTRE
jgi:putative ABC transport system permease protein